MRFGCAPCLGPRDAAALALRIAGLKLVGMSDVEHHEVGKGVVIEIPSAKARIVRPARPDGYRPITDPLWVWGRILGVPNDEAWRLFWSAARRLDTGHRQVERIRDAIENLPPTESPAGR
jgi:hypothetical protein